MAAHLQHWQLLEPLVEQLILLLPLADDPPLRLIIEFAPLATPGWPQHG